MKKQLINLYIIISLLLLSFPSDTFVSAKIQENENWQYVDSKGATHNESVIGIVQIDAGATAVAAAKINTTRGYSFPTKAVLTKIGANISAQVTLDLSFSAGSIFVTQEGGIAIIPDREIFGTINLTTSDGNTTVSHILNVSPTSVEGQEPKWWLTGDPAVGLTTTVSSKYIIRVELVKSFEGGRISAEYEREWIMSSNDELTKQTRRFKFTPSNTIVSVLHETMNGSFGFIRTGVKGAYSYKLMHNTTSEKIKDGASLNQIEEEPMEMTFEDGFEVPTYIKQTEGDVILDGGGLGLSQQSDEFVEYFLVKPKTNNGSVLVSFSTFLIPIVLILIIRRRKFH